MSILRFKLNILTAFIFSFLVVLDSAKAQQSHDPTHRRIDSEYWQALAGLNYVFRDGQWVPEFNETMLELEGQEITLRGYIVPFDHGNRFDNFGLSVLPIAQCHFCGRGDIPEIVEVMANKRIWFTTRPITIRGRLRLNYTDEDRMSFILWDADESD
jgi:hypothetical protein